MNILNTRVSVLMLSAVLVMPMIKTGKWTPKKALPGESRAAGVSFSAGGKGYLFGGCKGKADYKDLWMYDPASDNWTKRKACPGAGLREPVAFVINNIAYIGLGLTQGKQSSAFYSYDPAKDKWSRIADFFQNRRAARACSVDSMGFVFGGFDYGGRPTNELFAYNANTNTWEGRENLPATAVPRSYPVLEACNGKVYMMGGYALSGEYLADFWCYDPVTDEWTELEEFEGVGRTTASSFVLDGKIYIGLGKDATTYLRDWYAYDPEEESWTEVAGYPEVTTYGNAYFSIGDKGYICTGVYGSSNFSNKLFEFSPAAK